MVDTDRLLKLAHEIGYETDNEGQIIIYTGIYECRYCGKNCPNEPDDSEYLCDGFAGDIDNLYAKGGEDDSS